MNFSGITVNNWEKDRFWIGFHGLILADRSFILPILRVTGRTIVNGYVRVKRTLGEVSVVTEGGRSGADIVITVIRHSVR